MRFHSVFIVIFCFFAPLITAQYKVSGTISDKETGDLLHGANIRILEESTGAVTNKAGVFELYTDGGVCSFVFSHIGYLSDTIRITVTSAVSELDISLLPSPVQTSEVIVYPGENPALRIIRSAIEQKRKRNELLRSCQFDAYTKMILRTDEDISLTQKNNSVMLGISIPDSADMKITGIVENQSIGYYKSPGQYKDEIIARKQTANMPNTINILTGGRIIQDFYRDDVRFFDRLLTSPLADGALDFYYYYIIDTVSIDRKNIFKIAMEPDNRADAGFVGNLYIEDSTFHLLKVELSLSRAANTGGIFDSLLITQQFYPFGKEGLYMPVDYLLFARAQVLNLLRFGLELNTMLYDYEMNKELPDDIFGSAILTVKTDADTKDEKFWQNSQTLPGTDEEVYAYKRLDSLNAIPVSFWDSFNLLSTSIPLTDEISISAPLGMYHFNRVEGNAVDYSIEVNDAFNHRLYQSFDFGYGFADKRFKFDLRSEYLFGDYRTYSVSANVFRKTSVMFSHSPVYRQLTTTLLSLISKYEFYDYFYSDGFGFDVSGEVLPELTLRAGFTNRTDRSAMKNTDYGFFNSENLQRVNPAVYDAHLNTVRAGFTLDFRKYIENGVNRIRTAQGKAFAILKGMVHISQDKLLKTDLNYYMYEAELSGVLPLFRNGTLSCRFFGMFTDGALPYQLLYTVPGNIDWISAGNTFQTLRVNQIIGDKVFTAGLEYDMGTSFFRFLNIPILKDAELTFRPFLNIALSDISDRSREILPRAINTFPHPFYEAGFRVGQVLLPIEFSFAWKLNYSGENNFRFGIRSFILN